MVYGRDIVAPSREQTANGENQLLPKFRESPAYSTTNFKRILAFFSSYSDIDNLIRHYETDTRPIS